MLYRMYYVLSPIVILLVFAINGFAQTPLFEFERRYAIHADNERIGTLALISKQLNPEQYEVTSTLSLTIEYLFWEVPYRYSETAVLGPAGIVRYHVEETADDQTKHVTGVRKANALEITIAENGTPKHRKTIPLDQFTTDPFTAHFTPFEQHSTMGKSETFRALEPLEAVVVEMEIHHKGMKQVDWQGTSQTVLILEEYANREKQSTSWIRPDGTALFIKGDDFEAYLEE